MSKSHREVPSYRAETRRSRGYYNSREIAAGIGAQLAGMSNEEIVSMDPLMNQNPSSHKIVDRSLDRMLALMYEKRDISYDLWKQAFQEYLREGITKDHTFGMSQDLDSYFSE